MNTNPNDVAALIRLLTKVASDELRALAARNFNGLRELKIKKDALVAKLESVLAAQSGGLGRELEEDLEKLRTLTAEVASQLSLLRESARRAQARLSSVAAANRSSGVYGEHGSILPVREDHGRSA